MTHAAGIMLGAVRVSGVQLNGGLAGNAAIHPLIDLFHALGGQIPGKVDYGFRAGAFLIGDILPAVFFSDFFSPL